MSDNHGEGSSAPANGDATKSTEGTKNNRLNHFDPTALDRFQEIVSNAMLARQEFLKKFTDPRRDIDDECGYPKGWVNPQLYQDLYDREGIATRVVQVYPRESWQTQPTVYEEENPDTVTAFEEEWRSLSDQLQAEDNYFDDEEGSPVYEYLCRVDELAGIGQYGVLLLGIDDDKDYREPAVFVNKKPPKTKTTKTKTSNGGSSETAPPPERKLLFLRAFPESLAQITRYEQNPGNPRFGQPVMYQITLNDPRDNNQGVGLSTATVEVHWSRIIHVTSNISTSEVFGVPRMRPVLNRLLDLIKLYGGSAEMYWRGAFPGLAIQSIPQLGADVQIDREGTRTELENYMNGLQRYLALVGLEAKSLAPQVVDPTPQITVQLQAICIQLGIPMRVFMGSERGEMASTQDDAAWNDKLRARQHFYITPRIIRPFVNRLIALGVLPRPKKVTVWWPDLTSQSEQERAVIAATMTQAMSQYVGTDIPRYVAPIDYFTLFLKKSEAEALVMIENAKKYLEELKKQAQKEAAAGPLPANPLINPKAATDGEGFLSQQKLGPTKTNDSDEMTRKAVPKVPKVAADQPRSRSIVAR